MKENCRRKYNCQCYFRKQTKENDERRFTKKFSFLFVNYECNTIFIAVITFPLSLKHTDTHFKNIQISTFKRNTNTLTITKMKITVPAA
jgi:hypothetical protein